MTVKQSSCIKRDSCTFSSSNYKLIKQFLINRVATL